MKVRAKVEVIQELSKSKFKEGYSEIKVKDIEGGNYINVFVDEESEFIGEANNAEEGSVLGICGRMKINKSTGKNGQVYVNIAIDRVEDLKIIGQMRFDY